MHPPHRTGQTPQDPPRRVRKTVRRLPLRLAPRYAARRLKPTENGPVLVLRVYRLRGAVSFGVFADFGAFLFVKGLFLRRFCEKRVNFGAFCSSFLFFPFSDFRR
jgi:hypothetical protein